MGIRDGMSVGGQYGLPYRVTSKKDRYMGIESHSSWSCGWVETDVVERYVIGRDGQIQQRMYGRTGVPVYETLHTEENYGFLDEQQWTLDSLRAALVAKETLYYLLAPPLLGGPNYPHETWVPCVLTDVIYSGSDTHIKFIVSDNALCPSQQLTQSYIGEINRRLRRPREEIDLWLDWTG